MKFEEVKRRDRRRKMIFGTPTSFLHKINGIKRPENRQSYFFIGLFCIVLSELDIVKVINFFFFCVRRRRTLSNHVVSSRGIDHVPRVSIAMPVDFRVWTPSWTGTLSLDSIWTGTLASIPCVTAVSSKNIRYH